MNITEYPINLDDVINFLNTDKIAIHLDTYTSYAQFKNLSIDYVSSLLKSPFGATAYITKAKLFIIFINDTNQTQGRINWTISHEIAHIILNHYKIINPILMQRRGLSDNQYELLEKEADRFTQDFICNPIILSKCGVYSTQEIKGICNISDEAAENRLKNIQHLKTKKRYINQWDKLIINNFKNFIFKKFCPVCGYFFIQKDAKYCPICGNNNLKWESGRMKYPNNITINEFGQVCICPKCNNEEIDISDYYCKICGTYLIQKCIGEDLNTDTVFFNIKESNGCDHHIPNGNARYCSKCGAKTSLYYQRILKDWEVEKKEVEELDDLPF